MEMEPARPENDMGLDMAEVRKMIDASALFPEQIVYFKGLRTLDDVRREIAHIEASNRAARTYTTRTSKALLALRLILKGVPPWQGVPEPADDGTCDRCWRVPYTSKRDARRYARPTFALWDIQVWQCGQYWHVRSRKQTKRIRRQLTMLPRS